MKIRSLLLFGALIVSAAAMARWLGTGVIMHGDPSNQNDRNTQSNLNDAQNSQTNPPDDGDTYTVYNPNSGAYADYTYDGGGWTLDDWGIDGSGCSELPGVTCEDP